MQALVLIMTTLADTQDGSLDSMESTTVFNSTVEPRYATLGTNESGWISEVAGFHGVHNYVYIG